MANDDESRKVTRRRVLQGAAAVAAGGAAAAALYQARKNSTYLFLMREAPKQAEHADPTWGGSSVHSYRALGRTGIEMSDISFGGASISDPAVVARAVERGVNYFDTSVADVMKAVEGSLQRLRTDYLDVCIIHEVNSLDRLMAPNFHEAFDRLKQQGKVCFLGVSSHTPNLEEVMRHAVNSGRFDMLLVAYNFNNWPDLTGIFHDAHERGVGVVAMKTLKGAKATVLKDFDDPKQAFSQAAFKWVLSNPDVSGLVVSMSGLEQIDEYLYASGQPLRDSDVALLQRYDERIAHEYCRPGCGACLARCPYGVPVDDIFRWAMYREDYGRRDEPRLRYAALPESRNASQCARCPAPCEAACPFDIAIRRKMMGFDSLLRT